MNMKWLCTAAFAVTIGAGAAIAQAPEQSQKRDTSPAAQSRDTERQGSQSREVDRSGAADRARERAQSEQKEGAKDAQRGEAPSERGRQAQEQQGRESREPNRQSQEQGRERSPANSAQEEQRGRDSRQQSTEQQQRGREGQKDERAQDAKRPSDARQQQSQERDREQRDRRDQAAQPSGTSTQQQSDSARDQSTRTGQASGQTGQSAAINSDQRKQIMDQLRHERTATRTSNVRVDIGQRLPPGIQPHRLPPDIVRIAPQYRDYDYTLVDDRVVIVDPQRHEVVDILDEGSGYGGPAPYGRDRVVISDDMRTRFRELARGSSTTVGAASSSGGMSAQNCLSLQPVPEEMVRNNAELRNYRYLAVGDQIILVDPQQQKVVQVLE